MRVNFRCKIMMTIWWPKKLWAIGDYAVCGHKGHGLREGSTQVLLYKCLESVVSLPQS